MVSLCVSHDTPHRSFIRTKPLLKFWLALTINLCVGWTSLCFSKESPLSLGSSWLMSSSLIVTWLTFSWTIVYIWIFIGIKKKLMALLTNLWGAIVTLAERIILSQLGINSQQTFPTLYLPLGRSSLVSITSPIMGVAATVLHMHSLAVPLS